MRLAAFALRLAARGIVALAIRVLPGGFALLIVRLGGLPRFGLSRFRLLGRRLGAIRLETDAIVPRRGRWLIELEVKSAALVQLHWYAPFLLAGPLNDSRAAAARIAQFATEITAHIAFHMHRLFRAVDRALGEYVAENARLFQPVPFWIDRPGKPGFTGLAPILMRIFGGRAVWFDDECVEPLRHHNALDLRFVALLKQPCKCAVNACGPLRQGHELIAAHAFEPDLRLRHRLGRAQRSQGEVHAARLLDGAEAEVRNLRPQPLPLAAVGGPQANQISSRLVRACDFGEMGLEVEPEFRFRAAALDGQGQKLGHSRRAQRLDARGDSSRFGVARAGPGARLVAGKRRGCIVAGLDAAGGEGPEIARERIDREDAHIRLVIAAPAHRNHLRAEALDQALRGIPLYRRLLRCEGKALRHRLAFQRAAVLVGEGAGLDAQLVNFIGEEPAGELDPAAVNSRGEIVHGRGDA